MKLKDGKWLLLATALSGSLAWAAQGGVLIKEETLYASPAAGSAQMGKLPRGAQVDVVGKQGGWVQVVTGRTQGWVRMLSVRTSGGAPPSAVADLAGVAQMATGGREPGRIVATAGVRGLNEEELKAARYSESEVKNVESFTVTETEARRFAEQSRLARQHVAYLPNPAKATEKPSQNSWGTE